MKNIHDAESLREVCNDAMKFAADTIARAECIVQDAESRWMFVACLQVYCEELGSIASPREMYDNMLTLFRGCIERRTAEDTPPSAR